MEILTVENCLLENENVIFKMSQEGIAIKKQNNEICTINASNIKDIEMFRGTLGVNLRIYSETNFFLKGISESFIEPIIKICNESYKINLYLKELEIKNITKGDLIVNGKGFIEFSTDKTIFEIPIKDIDCIADIRNEISIKFDNVEVRFVTTKENIKEIKDACNNNVEEDLVIFENITMIYPRGKNNFMLYKEYFRIIGYSYDHKIYYRNVKEIYCLDKNYVTDKDKYIILNLDQPIRQGLTKYNLLVLAFSNEEIDIDINDSRLEKRYTGLLSDVLIDIFERLLECDSISSKFLTTDKRRALKCTYKAYEGQIYPLENCLIFLPRSIKINIKDIHSVEFSRINVSSLQAKTFDMTISAEANYTFNGMYKEDFGILEKYFNENNVTIRSEVYDEVISSEESEGEITDDDFIASEDEGY
ncbi:FACT complex subunit POB3 [Vairimorpha necatrix]|uniref:FACT complex subunit POB3 n=1 Tax=Vairimorpha necatrix TaxID=6039 RepID=A0AAX4JF93_9MICR